jgi:hypothetical protein
MVPQTFAGETKDVHKLTVRWQIEPVNEETGKRFEVQKRYTCSLNEKATLRKDLQSWRGRPFTPAELKGFDLEGLIGANALLSIVHNPSKQDSSRVFANVESIAPLHKSMKRMVPEGYVRENAAPDTADAETEPASEVTTEF